METEYETLRDGVVKALNLDWDDMQDGWWLPAEPGPVLCHTIPEAVEEALRLGENDERRLRDEVVSLTARAVRAERRAADLEQDRSDVWRTLGIAQEADADAAIDAIIAQRAPRPATP